MIEVWIIAYNPRYDTRAVAGFYDSDSANLSEIMKDLRANQLEIREVNYSKKASVDVFEIVVI